MTLFAARRWTVRCLIGSSIALSACSNGTGGSLTPASEVAHSGIQGALTKGPVSGATIEVFNFDPGGLAIGDAVATTTTNVAGEFVLDAVPSGGPFLVVSSGGQYFDESDKFGQRNVVLGAADGLESLLAVGQTKVAINVYTQALVSKARAEAAAQGVNFLALIESNRQIFEDGFGFDVLTTIPADPVSPAGSGIARAYAMALGGAANSIAEIVTSTGATDLYFGAVLAFAEDLSDGTLDGLAYGQAVNSDGQPIPDIDLNLQIRRFRNNNDAVYRGRSPLVIDELALATAAIPDPDANRLPSAQDDGYTMDEGGVLTIAAPGLLANDNDFDTDPLITELASGPTNAQSFALDDDGDFTYRHNGSETISDSFTYRVDDGRARSNIATVFLTINPVNDAPKLIRKVTRTVLPGGSVTIDSDALQASDPDNADNEIGYTVRSAPSCGTFTLDAVASNMFDQAQVAAGRVAFDSGGCAPDQDVTTGFDLADSAGGGPVMFDFTVTIDGPVNQPPVNSLPAGPISASANVNTAISGISIADPDADPASDTFTVTLSVGSGTLTLRTDVAGGVSAAQLGGTNTSPSVTVNATLDQINATLAASNGLSYQAASLGSQNLTVMSDDNGANGSGGAQTDTEAVQLVVGSYDLNQASAGQTLHMLGSPEKEKTGNPLTGIADFNADGYDDLLIPASRQDGNIAWVVFGSASPPGSDQELSEVGTGSGMLAGFALTYSDDGDQFGRAVAGGGDLNGDGIADLAISAERVNDNSGAVFVVFGSVNPPSNSLAVESMSASQGFRINGIDDYDHTGSGLAIGDVNGDGLADLVIGAHHASPNDENRAGSIYVLFGSSSPFPAVISASDLNGANGVRIENSISDERVGVEVSLADLDNDGLQDVIAGAPRADTAGGGDAGRIYVIYGSALTGGDAVFNLGTLSAATGFIIEGDNSSGQLGNALAGLPDINGDGIDDLVFGDRDADGSAYVLFGSAASPGTITPSSLTGANGFAIINSNQSSSSLGRAVSAAGDFDNDGNNDVLVADPLGSPIVDGEENNSGGEAFIIYGRSATDGPFPPILDVDADDGTQVLWIPGPVKYGEFGSRSAGGLDFNGDGRSDLLIGAPRTKVRGDSDVGISYLLFGF